MPLIRRRGDGGILGEPVNDATRAATLVTALFADVSGFTALADALDTDDLHEIIHPMITRLTGVAERAGGLLVKFGGDAILCVFAAEDDAAHASRAIDAALAMHDELESMKGDLPTAGRGLSMHIGVGTGVVPLGLDLDGGLSDRAVLGESVELAQRVEAQTPAGSTYVSGSAAALAGDRFSFTFVGEHELRGFDDPIPIWEVTGRLPGFRVSEQLTTHALTDLHRAVDERTEGALPVEQRRIVTVLFADPVVSTADGRDTRPLVVEVAEHLGAICDRYGAHVARFAGDAVLAFFGAPVTHEDDADRALLAAMGMQDACAELARSHDADVQVRIGVNTGRVIADHFGGDVRTDFSVLGDAVNTAQRIEAAAPLGQTYVSRETQRLTAGRFAFAFAGRLQLKGKPRPVPAWRLEGAGSANRAMARDRDRTDFVGRVEELASLRDALERVAEGSSAALAVLGEPGVGKSRLTRELSTHVLEAGYRWLTGYCISYGASVPYWPFADLVRRELDLRIDVSDDVAITRVRDALATLGLHDDVPFIARLLGHELDPDPLAAIEPEAVQRGIQDAFARWVSATSRDTPLVLAIEDVQWIDAASAELVEALLRVSGAAPVALYLTSRPEGRETVDRFLARSRNRVDVTLEPFGPDDTDLLVEAILGGPADDDMTAAISERTQGNPLFTAEVVRTLVEQDQLIVDDRGEWVNVPGWSPDQIPTSVENVIAARIDRLPAGTANVLTVGAAIGRRVLLPVLAQLVPDVDLHDEVDALMEAGFVDPADVEDEILIHHALVQDVAYSRLVRRRRLELHGRIAEVAETIYGSGDDVIDLLARHLYMAQAGTKAVEYLARAGERARRLFANEQASEHLAHAVEVARETDIGRAQLAQLLTDLGSVQETVGAFDAALASYEEARDHIPTVAAHRGVIRTLTSVGDHDRALDEAVVAATTMNDPAATALIDLERARTLTRISRYEESDAALVATDELPGAVRGAILLQRAQNASMRGEHQRVLELVPQAEQLLEPTGDLRELIRAKRLAGRAHQELGDLDTTKRVLAEAAELAHRIGHAEESCAVAVTLGIAHGLAGDHAASRDAFTGALRGLERINHRPGLAVTWSNLAMANLELGDTRGAVSAAERALFVARDLGDLRTEADVLDTLAQAELRRGRHDRAIQHANRAADILEGLGAHERARIYRAVAHEAADTHTGDRA